MQLSEYYTLIGYLTGDPNHDRYSTGQIDIELNNTQDSWNVSAKILKDTVTITTVAGTRQYALTGLTGTPIAFSRVTHKGIELDKKDKSYFDLYSSEDWTTNTGTPRYYLIETTDPDVQYISLEPVPDDAGANLVVEYIKRHTAMSASTDQPFNSSPLTLPYHWGMAYDAAVRLLLGDPNQENNLRINGVDGKSGYKEEAKKVLSQVVDTFKALEREEPYRIRGGRTWKY